MEPQSLEFEGTWDEIATHARRFAGRRLRLTILPDDKPLEISSRSIKEVIEEIAAQVPDEEWAKLPADLSENLDHYIYGVKRWKPESS